jgi:hypothetical protein
MLFEVREASKTARQLSLINYNQMLLEVRERHLNSEKVVAS